MKKKLKSIVKRARIRIKWHTRCPGFWDGRRQIVLLFRKLNDTNIDIYNIHSFRYEYLDIAFISWQQRNDLGSLFEGTFGHFSAQSPFDPSLLDDLILTTVLDEREISLYI